ncbi:MAG: type II toxin-antitoxin system HicA family toxin [Gammaproteobacteria bacterium]
MKVKQFIQKLRRIGVEIIDGRGKGGHVLAKYNGKQTTIPTHGDADMGNIFLKKICKQLGIKFEDL